MIWYQDIDVIIYIYIFHLIFDPTYFMIFFSSWNWPKDLRITTKDFSGKIKKIK